MVKFVNVAPLSSVTDKEHTTRLTGLCQRVYFPRIKRDNSLHALATGQVVYRAKREKVHFLVSHLREIEQDVTANVKNETFAVCLQLSVQYSENICIYGE